MWKKGVVLQYGHEATEALIEEKYVSNKIEVRVHGPQARTLLTLINAEFEKIHNRFKNIKVDELIPCNCSECQTLPQPHFYQYESLKKRIRKGKSTVECDNSYEDVVVKQLLEAMFVPQLPEKLPQKQANKRLLILFDPADTEVSIKGFSKPLNIKAELLQHFAPLKNIDILSSDLIMAHEKPKEIMEEYVNAADAILFLVSPTLLANTDIMDKLLPLAQDQFDKFKTPIIPVIARPCMWQEVADFADKQALPSQGKPITEHTGDYAAVLTEIVAAIKRSLYFGVQERNDTII